MTQFTEKIWGEKTGKLPNILFYFTVEAHHAGSDGSMSASGSAGPGFDPWRGRKFSF